MQHSGIRQIGRTLLTLAGILLLIIFGTRAASQATSLAAVGGQAKKTALPTLNNPLQLATLKSDVLGWATPRAAAESDSAVSISQVGTASSQAPKPVSSVQASVDDIVATVRQKAQLASPNSFSYTLSDSHRLVNQSAEHAASDLRNTQLLDKSRQN